MDRTGLSEFVDKVRPLFGRVLQLKQEMAWILFGQALSFVGGFVGIKVLTNTMGPDGYGQLALGLSIAGLFNLFIYGPIANVVARFYSVYRERETLGVFFAVLKRTHKVLAVVLAASSLVAGGICWLLAGREWGLLIAIASLYGIVSGINASYISLQSAVRDRKVVALHQGADVWFRIGLAIIFLLLFENSGYTALIGYLVGTLFVTASQNAFVQRKTLLQDSWRGKDESMSSSTLKEFSEYASSFVVFAGFAAVSMYADRWVLQGLYGESTVGIYAAIYQIAAAPVNLLFTMINQLMVPIIFERAGALISTEQADSSDSLVRSTVLMSGSVALLLALVAFYFGDSIVGLLTNPTFVVHYQILWVVVLGLSVFNVGQLFALKGLSRNKPKIYIWPKGIQALSFLILAYLGAQVLDLMGVAVALCGSSVLYVALVLVANSKLKVEVQV